MTSSLEAAKFRNVASHYKEAEPLTSNDSAEVAKAFQSINKCSPLMWPQLLQVDPGREFMGSVTKEMENHKTVIGSAIHYFVSNADSDTFSTRIPYISWRSLHKMFIP